MPKIKAPVEFTGPFTLPEAFEKFSKFGDPKSDGKTITLSQSDKWMKQAGVIGKKITTTDTGVCFNKYKARTINIADYDKFLQELAKYKQVEYSEMLFKLLNCGLPGQENKQQMGGAVDKLQNL